MRHTRQLPKFVFVGKGIHELKQPHRCKVSPSIRGDLASRAILRPVSHPPPSPREREHPAHRSPTRPRFTLAAAA